MLFLTKGLETPLQRTGCLRGDGEAPIRFQRQPVVSTALCHFFYPTPLKRLSALLPVLDSACQHHLCSFLAWPERGASEDMEELTSRPSVLPEELGPAKRGRGMTERAHPVCLLRPGTPGFWRKGPSGHDQCLTEASLRCRGALQT